MVKTKTTAHFIVTNTKKDDLVISTKTYDWKITLAPNTRHYQLLQHYISNNTLEELDVVLDMVYVTSTTMLSDMKLTDYILQYFKSIQETPLVEVSDEEDAVILKTLKDEETASDNE